MMKTPEKSEQQLDPEAVETLITPRRPKKDVCQIDRVNWLSFISFTWMFGYMWRSFRGRVAVDKIVSIGDLWTASIFDSANVNLTRLEHLWTLELRRSPQNPSFTRVVYRFFRFRLAFSCCIFLFCIVFGFIGPTCMVRGLITFLERPNLNLIDGSIDRSYGWTLTIGMFFVEVLRVMAYGATWAVSYRSAIRLRGAILALLYKHLSSAKSACGGKTSAEIVNIYANDGQRIFDAVTFAPLVLIGPFVLVGGLIYLLKIIGPLSLLAIAVFLIFDVLQAVFGIVMMKCRHRAIDMTDERMNLLGEICSAIHTIKINVWESHFFRRVSEVRRRETRFLKIAGYAQSMAVVSGSIVPVCATIVMVLAIVASGSDLLASDAFSSITVFFVMLFGVRMIPYGMRYIAEAHQSLKRINELLLVEKFDETHQTPHNQKLAVNLRNVSFSWASTGKNDEEKQQKNSPVPTSETNGGISLKENGARKEETLSLTANGNVQNHENNNQKNENDESQNEFRLKGLNLQIEKGELVGICGILGSGKTALLNAISGHMVDDAGRVEIAGSVAFCTQEPCILNDTVRENILFGQPMNSQRYYRAISAAQLTHDLERMPQNELSRVSAGQLSGGQRARIALARALYSNRDVYLLDDIFASINKEVASKIFQSAIKDVLAAKTVLLVTNDPNTLIECDKVLFLEKQGTVGGFGAHKEMLEQSQNYAEFFESLKNSEALRHPDDGDEYACDVQNASAGSKSPSNKSTNSINKNRPSSTSSAGSAAAGGRILANTGLPEEENYGLDAVKPETYMEYLRAGGGWPVFSALMLGFLFNVGANIFASYWLSKWMKDVHAGPIEEDDSSRIHYTQTLANSPDVSFYTTVYGLSLIVLIFSGVLKAVLFVKFTLGASTALHNTMLQKVLHAVSRFFHTTPTGQILNRFSRDIDELDVKLPFSLEAFLQCMITCAGLFLVICWVFPVFLLPAAPIFILFFLLVLCFRSGIRLLKRLENTSRSPLFEHISFSLADNNLLTIHSYGQTGRFVEQLKQLLDDNSSAMFLYNSAMRWQAVWLDLLVVAVTFIVSFLIVFLAGAVSPPEAGLAIAFALQLSGLFQFAVRSLTELEAKMTSTERIAYYCNNIETESESEGEKLPPEWPQTGEIQFENVVLKYSPEGPKALQNVSFKIANGEMVGVVGRTGSGKSSLCNALFRLYPIQSGRVLVGGADCARVPLGQLRRAIAAIPQEPVLFAGTIRFNLDPENTYSDDQIWDCLNRMDLDEQSNFFAQQKLNWPVELGGSNLSSGQRQLICMARAFLRNTRIIVLDEATSNIDLQTDAQLRKSLQRFATASGERKTVFMIAHRQGSIAEMDRVLEMCDGKLTIRGASVERNQRPSPETTLILSVAEDVSAKKTTGGEQNTSSSPH